MVFSEDSVEASPGVTCCQEGSPANLAPTVTEACHRLASPSNSRKMRDGGMQGLLAGKAKIEFVRYSEIWLPFYQIARHHILENSNFSL